MARTVTTALGLSGTPGLPIQAETAKFLKVLVHSSAQDATAIEGIVWEVGTGGALIGNKIGEFSGQTFESGVDGSGNAVLKVRIGDFGGYSLTTIDTPLALVRNLTKTTGIIPTTVIEE